LRQQVKKTHPNIQQIGGPHFLIDSICRFLTNILQIDNLLLSVDTFALMVCYLFVAF